MVVFIASRTPLPMVPWSDESPGFNVAPLSEHEEMVRIHLSLPYVCCAGSHTQCGCGFNEGREYFNPEEKTSDNLNSLESSSKLAHFIEVQGVEQIYSCWSCDEGEPKVFERSILAESLTDPTFFFRERELITILRSPA